MKEVQELYNEVMKIRNLLEKYNEFIERLESTTTDKLTANKIREFLKSEKVWN